MGITEAEELRLWEKISLHAISTEKPKRKCASIVDVKTMSFVNKSTAEVNSEGKEKESGDECCNEVEIGSKLGSNELSKQNTCQSYQIHLGDWSQGELGKLIKTKLGEADFYNSAFPSMTFETGNLKKDEYTDIPLDANDYHIMQRLRIPPKTKVTATILTKMVTYEVRVITEVSVNANTYLGIRFKGRIEKKLGSLCTATIRCLTAEDLFRYEAGFRMIDGVITFTREGTISYSVEEVEIITDTEEI